MRNRCRHGRGLGDRLRRRCGGGLGDRRGFGRTLDRDGVRRGIRITGRRLAATFQMAGILQLAHPRRRARDSFMP
ncbi:hypothetical protein [Sphingomonas hankookensis]|uniref:hypothetical protein n=1 Tax=Sphingomonas hankookensis TaxID=563996 RepID=UPI003D303092